MLRITEIFQINSIDFSKRKTNSIEILEKILWLHIHLYLILLLSFFLFVYISTNQNKAKTSVLMISEKNDWRRLLRQHLKHIILVSSRNKFESMVKSYCFQEILKWTIKKKQSQNHSKLYEKITSLYFY